MPYCDTHPVPSMYVPKALGNARKQWFLAMKYAALCTVIKKPEAMSYDYTKDQFTDLVSVLLPAHTGMRIYFASYGVEGSAYVPAGFANLLTLIYAPTLSPAQDEKTYYILNPGQAPLSIPMDTAREWVLNYQIHKKPVLSTIIQMPDGDSNSIFYTKDDLQELVNEMGCQPATGIRVYFASYTDYENTTPRTPNYVPKDYLKRLIVEMVLIGKDAPDEEFYIEDQTGFGQRPPREMKEAMHSNFDTGSPCPPAVCNGGELP